jgi:long-chain acyl-CoA synthetase
VTALYSSLPAMAVDFPLSFASRIAVQHLDEALTYAELRHCVLAFSARLSDAGVQPGDRVALLIENSPDYVVALFAILTLGATAIPLNPETSAATAGFVLRDSGARGCITRQRIRSRVDPEAVLPCLIVLENVFAANRIRFYGDLQEAVPPLPAASCLALLLYTSGTTGKPKGVMLTHANLLANTASIIEYMGMTAEDSTVTVLPFFHSFGNSVLLTHLAAGARVVIENRFAYPAKVVETLQQIRPSGFSGVPATFYILIHRTSFLQGDWSFLRYISQAGGGMRVETIRQLRQLMPSSSIFIMYGQTEASARLAYLPPKFLEQKTGSIGKAIPGVDLCVVDEESKETAPGQVGEIIARGNNVMAGYLNDPEGTCQAIRNGWLHTGDMATRDEDGFLYVVSRKSDFIKSASYRISPAEIEEVIAELGGFEDIAAIGVPDSLLGEAIAVCIVCPKENFNPEAIRSHCLRRLPLYKVPRYILHEPAIPRTASGKKKYYLLREKYQGVEGFSQ